MVYKKYEYDSFRIFAISTDQFKNCHMEVVFYRDAKTTRLTEQTFLVDMMGYTSLQYPTRRDMIIRMEELYNASYYSVTSKVGALLISNFVFDFLNPKYVSESSYLDDCLQFFFANILKPNMNDEGFDYRTFQTIKNRLQADLEAYKENPTNFAIRRSLELVYPQSISSKSILGNFEDLEACTREGMKRAYHDFFEHSHCDIYLIGNLDMDLVAKKILRYFKNPVIKMREPSLFVENKRLRSCKTVCESSSFVQSTLVMTYQMKNLTKYEKDYVLSLFGEILCGSSLNSRLYQYLRNENSLCYRVQTIYQKYDELLLIVVGLEHPNKDLAVKLIKKAMKEMAQGKICEEEIEMAKKQLHLALLMNMDNQNSLVNNSFFHEVGDVPLLEDRRKNIPKVTKKDLVALAKKFSLGLIYELKEGENHEED